MNYYLWIDEQQKGPFTKAQVRALFDQAQITGQTYIKQSSEGAWDLQVDDFPDILQDEWSAPKVNLSIVEHVQKLRAQTAYSVARSLIRLTAAIWIIGVWAGVIFFGFLPWQNGDQQVTWFVLTAGIALIQSLVIIGLAQFAGAILDAADGILDLSRRQK